MCLKQQEVSGVGRGFNKGGTGHSKSKDTTRVFPRMRFAAGFDRCVPRSLVVGSMS